MAASIVLGAVFLAAACCLGASSSPEADHDWQIILEQAGGPGSHFQDAEHALTAAKQHLIQQETALREFQRLYPADPRRFSARIRLASVLAAKGRLLKEPADGAEARKILEGIEGDPAIPQIVKADAGFARVSQSIGDAAGRTDDATRDQLSTIVTGFDTSYPGDRRTASLLAELATLYDAQPARKKLLLDEAFARTTDESLRERINDDLRRLAMLKHPVVLHLQPWTGGAPIDTVSLRGRAVVILFWASWSLPALHELAQLEEIATHFAGDPVTFLTVSLDEDRKALAGTIDIANLHWPVQCDGRGWKGELVRELGINALPTVWVLDRQGNLLALNARGEEAAQRIREALGKNEPPEVPIVKAPR